MKLPAASGACNRLTHLARHPVAKNAVALYSVQAARYLVPLALVPYLARVLRPEAFGRLAVAQSLAAILGVIVEFGFLLSATREIARERDSRPALREIAAGVLGAKVLLTAVILLIALALITVVPDFRRHPEFLWGALLLAVALGASPAWFFLGIERMPTQTAIEGCGLALGAGSVFILVRDPAHAAWVLYLAAGGMLLAALINHLRMYRFVAFAWPRWHQAVHMLRESVAMFCLRGTVALFTSANVFLLGLFVPAAAVADFAGAEKIIRAVIALIATANQAVFPRLSHLMNRDRPRAMRFARLLLITSAGVCAMAAAGLLWAAPWVVRLALGPGYAQAVVLLRWLTGLIALFAITNTLGSAILLPLKMDWAVTAAGIGAVTVNTAGILLLAPHFGGLGVAWSQIASEIAILGVESYFVARALRSTAAVVSATLH